MAQGAILTLLVAVAVLVTASPAQAHARVVRTEPASGATLAQAPTSVQLWFDEDVLAGYSSARIVDAGGHVVAQLRPRRTAGSSPTVALSLPALAGGSYGVVWRVLSADDAHTTSGALVFSVGAARPLLQLTPPVPSTPAGQDTALRWARLCLLSVLFGSLVVAGPVLAAAARRPPAPLALLRLARRRLLAVSAVAAPLAAIAGVAEQIRRSTSAGEGAWDLVLATRWGRVWLAQEAALVALALVATWLRTSRRALRAGAVAAGGLLGAVAALEALDSHAAALSTQRLAAMAAHALHTAAACTWLGALAALLVLLGARHPGNPLRPDVLRAVRGPFAVLAAGSTLVLMVTGLFEAGREVTMVEGLRSTSYGHLLLLKACLLAGLLALGLVNHRRLQRPALPRWGRTTVGAEAILGGAALLAVAALVGSVPPRSTSTAQPASAPPTLLGSAQDALVSLTASPGRPGLNAFTVEVSSTRRPAPAAVTDVRLALPGATVTLRELESGRWFGSGQLVDSPAQATVLVGRGDAQLAVSVPWRLNQAAPTIDRRPRHRLSPYTDALALLAALGLTGSAAAFAVRRRRAHTADRELAGLDPVPETVEVLG